LETFGGRGGVLNRGSIESAIGRPYSGYYRSIERKGAALIESLALNHGFVDGNKRTAVLALALLVLNSGYDFEFPGGESADDAIEELVLRIVEHQIKFHEIVHWLKARLVKADPSLSTAP
jgi:death-on-curing protein